MSTDKGFNIIDSCIDIEGFKFSSYIINNVLYVTESTTGISVYRFDIDLVVGHGRTDYDYLILLAKERIRENIVSVSDKIKKCRKEMMLYL